MNPWKQLLDVQAIDTSLTQLDHRSAQIPARAELARIEDVRAGLRAEAAEAEADKHEIDKQQKRIEDEISLVRDKMGAAEAQLYGGGSSDAKQLRALQDEVDSFKRRISALEDDELELMVQAEPIDERLAAIQARTEELDREAAGHTAALAEAEVEIDQARAEAQHRRAELVDTIDADALREYDVVRARLGGVAVARLVGTVCGACHIKLSAMEHDRIRHVPVEEPVTCEDCGRFLVRG